MSDTQRAVDPVAVLERNMLPAISAKLDIVAPDAIIVRSVAVVSGLSAAVHAFPVDILISVLLASNLATLGIDSATVRTEEVLRLGLLLCFVVHLLFTVAQSAKVRNLARIALVESGLVVSKSLLIAKIVVIFIREAWVVEDTLLPSVNHCKDFYYFS